jgi:hypothetical protein
MNCGEVYVLYTYIRALLISGSSPQTFIRPAAGAFTLASQPASIAQKAFEATFLSSSHSFDGFPTYSSFSLAWQTPKRIRVGLCLFVQKRGTAFLARRTSITRYTWSVILRFARGPRRA